ncbi:hypothetical protein [Noviherbaspirillum galbum]|uniref:Uncharacterized protein n=1 Tax=Noviherbaspirillum galbum TaxID=2709383 RepID=A0A6B3SKT3_9BURK|nr:hypothetical protein [Noviherbaspirillum galbum]NEX61454.1 hypothetical protein [Noviherbaspirillum galbum]
MPAGKISAPIVSGACRQPRIVPSCPPAHAFGTFAIRRHPALHWAMPEPTQLVEQRHPAIRWAIPAPRAASGGEARLVSPDGSRACWREHGSLVIQAGDQPPTHYQTEPGGHCFWHPDSRHLFLERMQDNGNRQLVRFDTDAPGQGGQDLVAWPGAVQRGAQEGESNDWLMPVRLASNARDGALLDIRAGAGDTAQNDGTVLQWLTGADGRIAGRVRQLGEENVFEVALPGQEGQQDKRALAFAEARRWRNEGGGGGEKPGNGNPEGARYSALGYVTPEGKRHLLWSVRPPQRPGSE